MVLHIKDSPQSFSILKYFCFKQNLIETYLIVYWIWNSINIAYCGDRNRPPWVQAPTSKLSVVIQVVLQRIPKSTNIPSLILHVFLLAWEKIIDFLINCELCIMKPMVNINVNQGYDCSSRDYGNHVAYNASMDVSIQV